jgi:hypothetical protein
MTKQERKQTATKELRACGAFRGVGKDTSDGGITRTGWWLDGVYLGSDVLTAISAVRG